MAQNFKEFMDEKKEVNRWLITLTFLTGMFAGACLMFMFAMAGLV